MNNTEKETKVKNCLKKQDLFKLKSIENVNHKPHPFCIGAEHIQRDTLDTTKGCAMLVDDKGNWSNTRKPGYHKCGLPYDDHTFDNICFLQQIRHGTNDEANIILKKLVNELGENFVDGFAFIETKEKYRITS